MLNKRANTCFISSTLVYQREHILLLEHNDYAINYDNCVICFPHETIDDYMYYYKNKLLVSDVIRAFKKTPLIIP